MQDKGFGREVTWDIPLLEGYQYKVLKNVSPVGIRKRPFGLINPSIVFELATGRFDLFIVHDWNYFTHVLGLFFAKMLGIKTAQRFENPLHQDIKKPPLKKFLKKLLFNTLFRGNSFLAIGSQNKAFLEYYGVPDEKIYFCPYSVDNKRFFEKAKELAPKRPELRKAYGYGENEVVILFVGKLTSKKRPMDLVKAFEGLHDSRARLLFVGTGELERELKSYVNEKNISGVTFAGFKNQSEMPECYALSDVFVLPSESGETWGLVVNEAMCFGLPVIVSDMVGASFDLVRDTSAGAVFTCGDVRELCESLKMFFDDEPLRKRSGERAREVIERWSYERTVEEVVRLLEG